MTQTSEATWFSESDKRDILCLLPQVQEHLGTGEQRKLQQLEGAEGRESDPYLQEVMRLYKEHMLGIFETPDSPKRERGQGKGKIGSHSEGKHR